MRVSRRILARGAMVAVGAVLLLPAPSALADSAHLSGAMEGDVQLPAGATVGGGYDVSLPSSMTVWVTHASVSLRYACTKDGAPAGSIVLAMPDATLSGTNWQPSGDQKAASVWQVASRGIADATSACGGGTVYVNAHTGGAVFSADFASSAAGAKLGVRFHYRETAPRLTDGKWSATQTVLGSQPPAAAPSGSQTQPTDQPSPSSEPSQGSSTQGSSTQGSSTQGSSTQASASKPAASRPSRPASDLPRGSTPSSSVEATATPTQTPVSAVLLRPDPAASSRVGFAALPVPERPDEGANPPATQAVVAASVTPSRSVVTPSALSVASILAVGIAVLEVAGAFALVSWRRRRRAAAYGGQ